MLPTMGSKRTNKATLNPYILKLTSKHTFTSSWSHKEAGRYSLTFPKADRLPWLKDPLVVQYLACRSWPDIMTCIQQSPLCLCDFLPTSTSPATPQVYRLHNLPSLLIPSGRSYLTEMSVKSFLWLLVMESENIHVCTVCMSSVSDDFGGMSILCSVLRVKHVHVLNTKY